MTNFGNADKLDIIGRAQVGERHWGRAGREKDRGRRGEALGEVRDEGREGKGMRKREGEGYWAGRETERDSVRVRWEER